MFRYKCFCRSNINSNIVIVYAIKYYFIFKNYMNFAKFHTPVLPQNCYNLMLFFFYLIELYKIIISSDFLVYNLYAEKSLGRKPRWNSVQRKVSSWNRVIVVVLTISMFLKCSFFVFLFYLGYVSTLV